MAGDLLRQRADGHRRAFGLAYGSLVAAWFLGNIPQTQQLAVAGALHHTFLAVGGSHHPLVAVVLDAAGA